VVGKLNGGAQESIIDNQSDKRLKAREERECTPQLPEKYANEEREMEGGGGEGGRSCLPSAGGMRVRRWDWARAKLRVRLVGASRVDTGGHSSSHGWCRLESGLVSTWKESK
jgi:hypothetical protein